MVLWTDRWNLKGRGGGWTGLRLRLRAGARARQLELRRDEGMSSQIGPLGVANVMELGPDSGVPHVTA